MSKFRSKGKGPAPQMSTASLPDIVFMLLFFFMVVTVMREVDPLIELTVPKATEIDKIENKSLVSYIYIGPPIRKMQAKLGSEPRIQLNDAFAELDDIPAFIEIERLSKPEHQRNKMFTSMKVDSDTKMGIVTDVKQELRKVWALKIIYSTNKSSDE